jgi:hypothetical protein
MVESRALGISRRVTGSPDVSGWSQFLMFWVYILRNPAGKFYIGQTDDLAARLRSHNRPDKTLSKFTRKGRGRIQCQSEGCWKLCAEVYKSGRVQLLRDGLRLGWRR